MPVAEPLSTCAIQHETHEIRVIPLVVNLQSSICNLSMPLVGIPDASRFLTGGFMAMAIGAGPLLVIGVHLAGRRLRESPRATRRWTTLTAIGAGAWLGVTWAAAETGHLSRLDLTAAAVLALPVAIVVLGVLMAFTRFGTRLVDGLPLAALIARAGVSVSAGAADAPGLQRRRDAVSDELFRLELRHRHRAHGAAGGVGHPSRHSAAAASLSPGTRSARCSCSTSSSSPSSRRRSSACSARTC